MALLAGAGAVGFVVNLPGESVAGYVEELEAFGETVRHQLPTW